MAAKQFSHDQIQSIITKLPKTELHLHLDGSLNSFFIIESAKSNGINLPNLKHPNDLRSLLMKEKSLRRANKKETVIDEYILSKYKSESNWKIFDFCNQFLQTRDALLTATKQLVIELALEHNVWIIEIRFCPSLHVLNGLTESEVTEAVINGYREGVQYIHNKTNIQIKGGIIICILRSFEEKHWFSMLDIAAKYLNKGVIGLDIAGNEAGFPLNIFEDCKPNLLAKCVEMGVPLTLHSGEFPVRAKTNENIEIAIKYAQRIGHGITLQFDENLMQRVKECGVGVECCLTSNVGGGQKVKSYAVHPIAQMRRFGIECCLNSDNTLLSGDEELKANPTNEILKYVMELGADWKEIKAVLMNGAKLSFDKSIDEQWMSGFEQAIDDAIASVDDDKNALQLLDELICQVSI